MLKPFCGAYIPRLASSPGSPELMRAEMRPPPDSSYQTDWMIDSLISTPENKATPSS